MTKKILFVDDDPVAHYIHTKIVKYLGIDCEVRIALNGKEALDTMVADQHNSFVPDYLFVDLDMPVMDGLRFIQTFHSLHFPGKENTMIIILTSSSNSDDRRRAVALGIDNYIVKPVEMIDMDRILRCNDLNNARL